MRNSEKRSSSASGPQVSLNRPRVSSKRPCDQPLVLAGHSAGVKSAAGRGKECASLAPTVARHCVWENASSAHASLRRPPTYGANDRRPLPDQCLERQVRLYQRERQPQPPAPQDTLSKRHCDWNLRSQLSRLSLGFDYSNKPINIDSACSVGLLRWSEPRLSQLLYS